MPPRVPKVCRERTCHQLTTERHGYCPAHVHLLDGWKKVAKVSAEDRGYDWAWLLSLHSSAGIFCQVFGVPFYFFLYF
ncbi:hypothetical protein JFQ93_001501 [Aeromonas sobria]|nr:hypothetical protein [Aeromonas sobria]